MLRIAALTVVVAMACILSGCVLGAEQAPGCRVDHPQDCESGWSCRDGVCMKPTTTLSAPDASTSNDAPDASDSTVPDDASQELEASQQEDVIAQPETGEEPVDEVGAEASGDADGDATLD